MSESNTGFVADLPRGRQDSTLVMRIPGWLLAYAGGTILLGVAHVLLGCSPLVALLAVGAVLLSLIPASLYGWRDMPALIVLLGGVRYVTTALIWKLIDGDPLDSGLYAPLDSFTVVLVGTFAMTISAILAHLMWRGRPLLPERYSGWGYVLLIAVGFAFVLIFTTIITSGLDVPGGFVGLFRTGFVLLPVAWAGYNWASKRKLWTPGFVASLAALLVGALAFNSRQGVGYSVVAIAAFVLCFRVPVRPILLVAATVGLFFFATIVAPAVSDVRIYKRQASPSELIELTIEQIGKRLRGDYVDPWFDPNAAYQLRYLKHANNFTNRLVSVQQLDFVVARAASQGQIGTERFYRGLWELFPAFIVSDKSTITNPDYAFWIYGVIPYGMHSFIEATPYGNAYSFGGLGFTFWSVLFAFLSVFFLLRVSCPRFSNSLLATFILATYVHEFTAGYILTIYGIAFRLLPLEILLFWASMQLRGQVATRSRL